MLEFQADNVPTTTSKAVKIFNSDEIGLTSTSTISSCLWFKANYFRGSISSYLFSYATSDKNNNDFNLGIG